MKNKCALLISALVIISALLIIPNYKVSASIPVEYQQYIDKINTNTSDGLGFFWGDYTFDFGGYVLDDTPVSPNECSWVCNKASLNGSDDIVYTPYYASGILPYNIITAYIVGSNDSYTLSISGLQNTSHWKLDYDYYHSYNFVTYIASNSDNLCSCANRVVNEMTAWNNIIPPDSINKTDTLENLLLYLSKKFRNINISVNGDIWSYASSVIPPLDYGIMSTNKGLKVNGADFSFYTSYTNNKFTIAYNYSLTNRDSSDSNLRIEAGDLLTFELYAKVPTNEFVEHYISENGLGDATPSIILDVARGLKSSTNIINTPSIPTTTVYGLNYYGYNEDDAVEYDNSYYNYQYGNDQNGILTFRVTSDNNSANSPNLLAQLVSYYGSEREAIIGSAMGYIDYCRSYVVNISDGNWNVYNPYYTYFFQVKDESGRNVIRANSFEGTPQQFDSNDVENGESVGDVYAPSNNQSDIENSYTGGITNSYNTYVNNYYNTSEANQELLDYLYRYRDGGQQEDIQNAYGYLNSTIDSVSNVPVVLGKLFMGFFPTPVILLFNAMFIIFAVFIIIKIIRHLFL